MRQTPLVCLSSRARTRYIGSQTAGEWRKEWRQQEDRQVMMESNKEMREQENRWKERKKQDRHS